MSWRSLRRVTPQHTTGEAIEIMNDMGDEEVLVVDAETKERIAILSRATLVQDCVRAWHEPARCRIGRHVDGFTADREGRVRPEREVRGPERDAGRRRYAAGPRPTTARDDVAQNNRNPGETGVIS
jgi:hypothetical protein